MSIFHKAHFIKLFMMSIFLLLNFFFCSLRDPRRNFIFPINACFMFLNVLFDTLRYSPSYIITLSVLELSFHCKVSLQQMIMVTTRLMLPAR